MKAPGFWQRGGATLPRLLLAPFSLPWRLAGGLRRAFTKPVQAEVPVICVGNLTVGGAGKTPTVMYLADCLRQAGMTPGVLARGYGGRLSSARPVVVDPTAHSAADVGDEALLHAAYGPVVICSDRPAGAKVLSSLCDVILMDDGHQNPSLIKDISILVIDAAEGLGNGAVVPAGPLREEVGAGLMRANAIVAVGPGVLDNRISRSGLPVMRGRLVPDGSVDLKGQRVLGFSGIGRPDKFRDTLKEMGAEVAGFQAFGDHHPFTANEINKLRARAKTENARLVTTAKDAIRLTPEQCSDVTIVHVALALAQPDLMQALLERSSIGASGKP